MALHWGISYTLKENRTLRTVGRFDDIVHIIILYVYTEGPLFIVLNNRSITTG